MRACKILLVLALVAACSREAGTPTEQLPVHDGAEPGAAASAPKLRADDGRDVRGFAAVSGTPDAAFRPSDAAPAMVVRSGAATLEVDSLEHGLATLQSTVIRLGGRLGGTTLQGGGERLRRATVDVRVPAERFDDLLVGLRPLGRIETIDVHAEDVGEEFVDLTARAANARRLEDRLVGLLATRTGKLQDVLTVERELARVREEIERYEGRLRYLHARATESSLSVTLHEQVPIVGGDPGPGILERAVRQAWRNFIGLLAAFIESLGVLVPLAVAGSGVVLGIRRLRRA